MILTTTGLYLAAWEFTGSDMDSLTPDESWHVANRLAKKLRLGRGRTAQCDLIRKEYSEYWREAEWPDAVSYLIEESEGTVLQSQAKRLPG